MEGIRLRSRHTVPSVRWSDSTEHVPQARQPAPNFDRFADVAHGIHDSAAILQLARAESSVRCQRVPADVLHHRIHRRAGLGFIRFPGQALAAGTRQWNNAHRRHTGNPVRPAGT